MSQTQGITLPAVQLIALVERLFVAAGIPKRSAHTVAEALVDADLEGVASHGVMLVDMYLDRIRGGSVSAEEQAAVVSDRGAAVVLDAHNAPGQLTADQAIGIAVERARRYGAGIVAVRHAFHFGTARRYAAQAIGRMGKQAQPALSVLVTALQDDDPEVRMAICESLVSCDADPALYMPTLINLLASEQRQVRVSAMRLLTELGPQTEPYWPEIHALETSSSAAVRAVVRKTLEALDAPAPTERAP